MNISVSLSCFLLALLIPQRLQKHERYVTWVFTAAFAWTFEVLFGMILDLYDYGPTPKVELSDWLQVNLMDPSLGLLFVNFYPRTAFRRLCYTLAWTSGLVLLEFIYVQLGWMTYKGWHLWYSALFDPLLLQALWLNVCGYRLLLAKRGRQESRA